MAPRSVTTHAEAGAMEARRVMVKSENCILAVDIVVRSWNRLGDHES